MNKALMTAAALVLWFAGGTGSVWAQDQGPLGGEEQRAMSDTMQHALEYNPSDQASDWVNPDTDHSGSVAPVRTFENAQGQPCREFVTTIQIGGKQEQGYGTACRQPDGSWEIVSDEGETAEPPPPTKVYVYPPPAEYYAYPSGFYGPSRIYLSFSYVYRGDRVHHGRPYLRGPEFWHRYRHPARESIFVGRGFYRHYDRDRWRHRDQDDRWRRDGDQRQRWGDRGGDRDRDNRWQGGDDERDHGGRGRR